LAAGASIQIPSRGALLPSCLGKGKERERDKGGGKGSEESGRKGRGWRKRGVKEM